MAVYEFIRNILTLLRESEALSDITFLFAYPSSQKPVPIKKITAALGGEEISVTAGALGGVYGGGTGRDAEISLSLTIYAPYKSGGEECIKAFCRICEEAVFSESAYVKSFKCSSVSSNRDADAFVLKGTMVFGGEITKEDE